MKKCLNCGEIFDSADWHCRKCQYIPMKICDVLSFTDQNQNAEGFEKDHFRTLAKLESSNFWFKGRNRIIVWILKKHFPFAVNLIEIGCGTGFVLSAISRKFPRISLSGSDLYLEGLHFAVKRLPSAKFYQIDASRIPFHGEYDVIGSFDVLEHIRDDRAVLKEMKRALKDDGGLIITVPQHPFLWSDFDVSSCHIRRYTRRELITKLRQAGLKPIFVSSFVTFLLPVMYLTRFMLERDKLKSTSWGLTLPRIMNTIFECFLLLEQLFIQFGFSMPIGGSLIAVAKNENH